MEGNNLSFSDGFTIGVALAEAAIERGDPHRVFDWDKAARLIIERCPKVAEAGLKNDWPSTGGVIWRNGAPVPRADTYTYLGSRWAMPQIILDDEDAIDCWIDGDQTDWDAYTYWPDSALAIVQSVIVDGEIVRKPLMLPPPNDR